jgi:isoquinoline 1-oxidoreductase
MIQSKDDFEFDQMIEPERYELFENPAYRFFFDRRSFMKVFGGGIVLLVPLSRLLAQETQRPAGESGRGQGTQRVPNDIGAWIHVNEDGGITVYTGKVEMGQNIRTSISQAVADELHVPI